MPREQRRGFVSSIALSIVSLIVLLSYSPAAGAAGRPLLTVAHAASRASARAVSLTPFLGRWRVYSARLFYDAGGASGISTPVSRLLTLAANGTWKYGPSTGKWSIQSIKSADWKRWESQAYGPTRKIVFVGWSKGTVDGPIEGAHGRVDFFWMIYHVRPPVVTNSGIVEIKFGHANL